MKLSLKGQQALAVVIVAAIRSQTDPLKAKIATLEAEVETLKARPLQKWAGTYVPGMQYSEASLVTHRGSLWAAMKTTTYAPGDNSGDWRLIVKRGHA
jgi:hypothetical protein